MPLKPSDIVRDVTAAPLGDIIQSVGEGVAAAQAALDEASLRQSLELYREGGDEMVATMRAIGYQPTFYSLPDTTGEVTVALSLSGEGSTGSTPNNAAAPALNPAIRRLSTQRTSLPRLSRAKLYATPVDAGYSNRYGYSADMQAKVTFRIVPVPPPEGVEGLRHTPSFTGREVKDVAIAADLLGLTLAFKDEGGADIETPDDKFVVSAQVPEPETLIDRDEGEAIILTVRAPR